MTEKHATATLVVEVGYQGTGFAGFAAQPGQRTVQGALTEAFETLLRRPCDLTCAGRTDAGVHSCGQYVSLSVTAQEEALSARRLQAGLSALTPHDISIRSIWKAGPEFSARFDALARSYIYRIAAGPVRPVLSAPYTWWYKHELDSERMNDAAQLLVGEHNFISFCKAESAHLLISSGLSTSRNIQEISVWKTQEVGDRLICVTVQGNAFLHNMVRIIVGSLVEVGRGKRDAAWLKAALEACDRRAAGPTAPAQGLQMESVLYPKGALSAWE